MLREGETMTYFDNAATSRYKPTVVLRELMRHTEQSANSGRGAHDYAVTEAVAIEKTRELLKTTLGAKGCNVCFTKNCTEALNLAIQGGQFGGNVVTTIFEHNSMLRPLYHVKMEHKGSFVTAEPRNGKFITAQDLEPLIDANTSLIAVNYVSNVTGAVADLNAIGELARAVHVPLLVDGAQGVPCFPLDMKKQSINMLAIPAHKGFHATQGVGALLFDKSIRPEPLLFGGTGISSANLYQPKVYPESLESGTLFAAGIAALGAGVQWTTDNLNRIRSHVQRLTELLITGLTAADATIYTTDTRAGIVSFNLGKLSSEMVANELNSRGFAVRGGLHCAPLVHKFLGTSNQGAVRASLGMGNTAREVRAFLRAVEDICEKLQP